MFALLEVGCTIKSTCVWQNIQIHFVSFPLHTRVKKHPSTTYPNMHSQESRTGGFEEVSTTAFLAHQNSKRVQRSVFVCNQRSTHPSPLHWPSLLWGQSKQLLQAVHLSTNTAFNRQLLFFYILPQKFGFFYSDISDPSFGKLKYPFCLQTRGSGQVSRTTSESHKLF